MRIERVIKHHNGSELRRGFSKPANSRFGYRGSDLSQAKALEMNGHRVEDIQLLLSLGGSQRKKRFLGDGMHGF